MKRLSLLLSLLTTLALAADPVLSFVFKTEKLDLDASGLADASPSFSQQTNEPLVMFRLSKPAARAFGELTARHVGEQMDIIVCGKIISSPVIREPIQGSSGQLSGGFTPEETTALALTLKTGRCPSTSSKSGGAGGKGEGGSGQGEGKPSS
jgi:preprotein translocase subunit SecD